MGHPRDGHDRREEGRPAAGRPGAGDPHRPRMAQIAATSEASIMRFWKGFGIVFVCFFLSGATGLIYQVLWLRMLSLVFGHTVYAITTVLAAFMGGLALGSFVFARRASRIR